MATAAVVRTPAVIAVVAALLVGAGSIERIREQRYPNTAVIREDTLYVASGETLKRLTAGYSALAADLYWIRTLQYFGGIKLRLAGAAASSRSEPPPTDYALLYPLLDLTTTLDPQFNIAYRFGAIFLAEPFPGGAGRPDLAIALLEKGLRARPEKWEYMQDIGFVHYWWRHDYTEAAGWFSRAAALPGAPWFLAAMAATTLAEGQDRESSRTMWQSIAASAEIDWLRNEADRRLQQLRAMDEIDELQQRADRVTVVTGRPPGGWADFLPGVPVDPMQTAYELRDGRVRLSPSSPLFPLPDEPQHLPPAR